MPVGKKKKVISLAYFGEKKIGIYSWLRIGNAGTLIDAAVNRRHVKEEGDTIVIRADKSLRN